VREPSSPEAAPLSPVTLAVAGRPQTLLVKLAALRVVEGPDAGAEHEIGETPVVIGTHPSCSLLLHDRTVSSRHAEIGLRPAGYLLRDLGSRNGIVAGGWRVEQIYLAPGMRLALGGSVLEVVDLERSVELALSAEDRLGDLVGGSTAMRRVFALLESCARSEATVLLEGETGTGKEAAAEALHRASAVADGPFVVFDCSAVSPALIESELFGHERGAFTGAVATHVGALERAAGGTLFMDEIGELPLAQQPKLLRAMEAQCFQRVGGQRPIQRRARIVAATRRNLGHEVRRGRFRQDLYYRLAVLRIAIPPLRERLGDLPLLIDHFSRQYFPDQPSVRLRAPGLIPVLASYGWPGNVRELRNVVERLGLLPPDRALPTPLRAATAPASPGRYARRREQAVGEFERGYLCELLRFTGGNVTQAAEVAGLSRRHLTRLIAEHQIDRLALDDDPGGEPTPP
jgi:DNA-binding NtrC family response regulator